jgi:hypothetical protein
MLPKKERERMFNEGLKSDSGQVIQDTHPALVEGLRNFMVYRLPAGGFLMTVLMNDLMGAVGKADSTSQVLLPKICQFIYNYAPHNSHGSRDVVRDWLGEDEPEDD